MAIGPGSRLGPYVVSGPLGSGGMGEVWRGRDPRLGRDIALKVLPDRLAGEPGALDRFRVEALAASALSHPGIVTVYDVGEAEGRPFLCMEFVEGETLRALLDGPPLSPGRALRIGAQVADALAAAHEKGIVHRDLKPENLLVTSEGKVKVLDFGLAKVSPLFAGRADETGPAATSPGALLGTVGYMSPEQASGGVTDFRSDQFALGTILHEMLTGTRTWRRPTDAETLAAIIREEPPPLGREAAAIPSEARRVVARCLGKEPSDRYASTRDLARDLAEAAAAAPDDGRDAPPLRRREPGRASLRPRVSTSIRGGVVAGVIAMSALTAWAWLRPGRAAIESLAILPFADHDAGSRARALGDGLAESLIERLSRIPRLRVMARATVLRYRDAPDPLAVGRRLGVDAVLTGSVARLGGRISVDAELADARTGERLWGTRTERAFEDVVRLQESLAADIAGALRLELGREERAGLARSGTEDPAAWQLFLEARSRAAERTEEALLEGLRLYRQAVERDPSFARALLGIGDVYGVMATDGFVRPAEAWPLAEEYTRRALAADPRLAGARAHLAVLSFFAARRWGAVEDLARILAAPTWPDDVDRYVEAQTLMLWATRRLDEALALLARARDRDPGNISLILRHADCASRAGRTDEAAAAYRLAVDADPSDPRAPFGLSEVLLRMGDAAGARAALQRAFEQAGEEALARRLEGAAGPEAIAAARAAATRQQLVRLEALSHERYVSPLDLARLHALLGEKDSAFSALDAAEKEASPGLAFLRVDDAWDGIRDDPRFELLASRLELP